MKKLNLLILAGTAGTLMTLNLFAGDVLLTPRAKDNQPKVGRSEATPSTVTSPVYAMGTPRAADQQAKKTASAVDAQVMSCARHMSSSPKAAGECASHPGAGMSCCAVAKAH